MTRLSESHAASLGLTVVLLGVLLFFGLAQPEGATAQASPTATPTSTPSAPDPSVDDYPPLRPTRPETTITAAALASAYLADPQTADRTYRDWDFRITGKTLAVLRKGVDGYPTLVLEGTGTADVVCVYSFQNSRNPTPFPISESFAVHGWVGGLDAGGNVLVLDCQSRQTKEEMEPRTVKFLIMPNLLVGWGWF